MFWWEGNSGSQKLKAKLASNKLRMVLNFLKNSEKQRFGLGKDWGIKNLEHVGKRKRETVIMEANVEKDRTQSKI